LLVSMASRVLFTGWLSRPQDGTGRVTQLKAFAATTDICVLTAAPALVYYSDPKHEQELATCALSRETRISRSGRMLVLEEGEHNADNKGTRRTVRTTETHEAEKWHAAILEALEAAFPGGDYKAAPAVDVSEEGADDAASAAPASAASSSTSAAPAAASSSTAPADDEPTAPAQSSPTTVQPVRRDSFVKKKVNERVGRAREHNAHKHHGLHDSVRSDTDAGESPA
jgi:hypothetical protein